MIVSLCSNLGILVFFKYADFFTQDVLHLPVRRLNLILPAGISFHTFQSLSYTIDVYRRQLQRDRARSSSSRRSCCSSRSSSPARSCARRICCRSSTPCRRSSSRPRRAALFRIVVGLFKKIALADTLALSIVDRVFESAERFSAVEVLAGVYGYALQIYLDFSAYSDIAIGSAQVLGFELPGELPHAVSQRRTSRSSGGAGTSRCRPGCATTSTSRSAATAARRVAHVREPDR